MSYETILYEKQSGVATITLNRPQALNAFTSQMNSEFMSALREAEKDGEIRSIVITGAGRAFCAGQDLKARSKEERGSLGQSLREKYNPIILRLRGMEKIVLAAVNGIAAGAGCNLALACDLRIAARSAFFAIPAARLGLAYPPEALGDLLEAVSPSNAKRLLFSAERLTAEKALDMGLVNEVVDDTDLNQHINALSETLCANAPLSLKAAKQAINRLAQPGNQADAAADLVNAQVCIDSADYREGCRAFLEKRSPVFTGI